MKKLVIITMCALLISCGRTEVRGTVVTEAYHQCKEHGGVLLLNVDLNGGSINSVTCMDGANIILGRYVK